MIDPSEASGYPQVGEIVDEKYRVERLLGAGGMGAVVEATHLLRRAPVALKFMSARLVHDPAVVERFLNEGVAASRINNEHVVSVLDVSKLANGQPYLVMEYLEGRDLAKLLATEGVPGLAEVPRSVHFVLQVLRGLQVAHAAGIIHRDLKPANCLVVERDGEPDFLKIVDFGISKVKSDPLNLTKVGSALGTPLYVSPEQARDPASVDARGDLYSVATILYELLVGRTPFHPESGQLSELFMALATLEPPSLERVRGDLPPGLDGAIRVGLAKSPDGRYRSAAEMAAALAPFADLRSERVLRQLLQRTTLRPFGSSPPSPYGSSPPSPYGSSPPVQPSAPPVMRTGPGSVGAPTERAPTPPPASYRPSFSPPVSPAHGVRSAQSAPSPPTEKLGASSPSGVPVGWTALPSDTAAPTTQPTFLRRRQTEIKIAVPVLAALILAALLFRTLRSTHLADDAGGIAPAATRIATDVPLAPPAATPPAVAPPVAPPVSPPGIRVVPGGSALPAASPAGNSAPVPAPTPPPLVTSPPANTPAPSVTPLPGAASLPGQDNVRPSPPPQPSSASPPSSGGKRRRPSLKQIGISE